LWGETAFRPTSPLAVLSEQASANFGISFFPTASNQIGFFISSMLIIHDLEGYEVFNSGDVPLVSLLPVSFACKYYFCIITIVSRATISMYCIKINNLPSRVLYHFQFEMRLKKALAAS
jgi:hypothetical protein